MVALTKFHKTLPDIIIIFYYTQPEENSTTFVYGSMITNNISQTLSASGCPYPHHSSTHSLLLQLRQSRQNVRANISSQTETHTFHSYTQTDNGFTRKQNTQGQLSTRLLVTLLHAHTDRQNLLSFLVQ